jgi:hypothetical protein
MLIFGTRSHTSGSTILIQVWKYDPLTEIFSSVTEEPQIVKFPFYNITTRIELIIESNPRIHTLVINSIAWSGKRGKVGNVALVGIDTTTGAIFVPESSDVASRTLHRQSSFHYLPHASPEPLILLHHAQRGSPDNAKLQLFRIQKSEITNCASLEATGDGLVIPMGKDKAFKFNSLVMDRALAVFWCDRIRVSEPDGPPQTLPIVMVPIPLPSTQESISNRFVDVEMDIDVKPSQTPTLLILKRRSRLFALCQRTSEPGHVTLQWFQWRFG